MKGVVASVELGEIKFKVEELPEPISANKGYALVKIMAAGLCESDIDYYNNRFKEALMDSRTIIKNFFFLESTAVYNNNRDLFKLLRTAGHEGWGVITDSNLSEEKYTLAILEPNFKEKKLTNVKYKVINYRPNYKKGDWVVISPAQRCDIHNQIGKDGWPSKACHRKVTPDHKFTKKVTGHLEYPGLTVDGVISLHESMLYKVPSGLKEWLDKNGELKHLLVYAEPLGCVMDALKDFIRNYWEKDQLMKNCLIIGDGPNGMLLTSTIKTLMPTYRVTVAGFHDEKLEVIAKAGADRIVNTYKLNEKQTRAKIKDEIKYDLVISTVPITDFKYLDDLIKRDADLIMWATEKQDQKIKFKTKKIHKPYGGLNGGEYNAMLTMHAIMKTQPEYLKAWDKFPTVRSELFFAADMYQTWYKQQGCYPDKRRLGKLMVVMQNV